MSKPRPKGTPFAMPGFDAFGNLGNIMNFDAIDKEINAADDEDIDEDELEKELLALESNTPIRVQRRAPPKPEKKLQVCFS
jgi:hypothetical protein